MEFPPTSPLGELLTTYRTRRLNVAAMACLPGVLGALFGTLGVLGLAGIHPWGKPEGHETAGALRLIGFGALMVALSVGWVRRRLRRHGVGWALYEGGLAWLARGKLLAFPFDAVDVSIQRLGAGGRRETWIHVTEHASRRTHTLKSTYVADLTQLAEVLRR